MRILVTGGAGFIGSNFLVDAVTRRPEHDITNLDALTYAGQLASLEPIAGAPRYRFVHGDITDAALVADVVRDVRPELIVHFAAESHVDRSIAGPGAFVATNVTGTFTLLEACRAHLPPGSFLFHHIGTDEVYGPIPSGTLSREGDAYAPTNPYAATKAAADHLVRAYATTYGLRTRISTATNNYGPRQFPEKLVPLLLLRALDGEALPLYGDGRHERDWLFVGDHCEALWALFERGGVGETYNVGAMQPMTNLAVAEAVCRVVAEETGRPLAALRERITFVTDRPGHDRRYASDTGKLRSTCGWTPQTPFDAGLRATLRFYLTTPKWLDAVRKGPYASWVAAHYDTRGTG